MPHHDGSKSGGRKAGTPNKAPRKLQRFLDGVFTEALDNPAFRAQLLLKITLLELDSKVLLRLLEYWAGAPPKNHKVDVGPSLASIIAGTAASELVDDDDQDDDQ